MKLNALIIFLVILKLNYFADNVIISLAPVVVLVIAILNVWKKGKVLNIKNLFKIHGYLLTYVLIVIISLMRTNGPHDSLNFVLFNVGNTILFTVFCASFFIYFWSKTRFRTQEDVLIDFCIVPFCMLAVSNFILFLLHVTLTQTVLANDHEAMNAVLLSHLGLNMSRVQFPLEAGFNNYAVYIGGVFCLSISMFFFHKKRRLITGFAAAVFLATLLCVDSRSSLYFPFIILVIIYVVKSWQSRFKKTTYPRIFSIAPIFVILGPLLFLYITPIISQIPELEFISRGGNELKTGNSRYIIWNMAVEWLGEFQPKQIIGYGLHGHYGSGVSKRWAYMFVGWKDSEVKSPHNTALSAIFDYGYIGFLIYLGLLFNLFKKIRFMWNAGSNLTYPLISFLLYTIFAGISESMGNLYFLNFLLLFIIVAAIINTQSIAKDTLVLVTTIEDDTVPNNTKPDDIDRGYNRNDLIRYPEETDEIEGDHKPEKD
jgi:hypothetical protein